MSWFRRKPKPPPPSVLSSFYRWLEFCRRHELMTVEESNEAHVWFTPRYMEIQKDARNARLD